MAASDLEILAIDSQHCLAVWRGLVFQCWNETHASAVDDNIARVQKLRAADSKPIAALVILEPDAPPPDAVARGRLDALTKSLLEGCVCVAYVYQGTGFRAAAVRGIMIALTLLKSTRMPSKVCATVTEALTFMAPFVGDQKRFGTAQEQARVVSELQTRFAARPR